jgi:hypothetical protein
MMDIMKLGKQLGEALGIEDKNIFHRLWVKPDCYKRNEVRMYNVPDAKTGLILMDILLAEYRALGITDTLIDVQYSKGLDGEWEDWSDGKGNDIKAYEIDENFAMFLVE